VDGWMMANSHGHLLKAWTLETSFVSLMSEEFRRTCENMGFPMQISRMIFVPQGGCVWTGTIFALGGKHLLTKAAAAGYNHWKQTI